MSIIVEDQSTRIRSEVAQSESQSCLDVKTGQKL